MVPLDSIDGVSLNGKEGKMTGNDNSHEGGLLEPFTATVDQLHQDLRILIAEARHRTASNINIEMTRLYWMTGRRLRDEVVKEGRAAYGEQVVSEMGKRLALEFGRGFQAKNLHRMIQFYVTFPDSNIVVTLSRQLGWSHFLVLIPIKGAVKRDFYARLAAEGLWSVRELRRRIDGKTYERSALAAAQGQGLEKAMEILDRTGTMPVEMVFKDPYFLDFLGLRNTYDERELENAILRELESFILELGAGFAFIERQKRMIIDGEDFYLDLLFYHRKLRRLVAVELKLGRFKAAYKGQMELYLRWLERYDRSAGEDSPIGLILCAESGREQVELLEMHRDGIVVAEYWTELPSRDELERKLHQALIEARERLAQRELR